MLIGMLDVDWYCWMLVANVASFDVAAAARPSFVPILNTANDGTGIHGFSYHLNSGRAISAIPARKVSSNKEVKLYYQKVGN